MPGITYLFSAFLLLFSGIIRGELISTLCGSTLLAYSLFSFFQTFAVFLFWKNSFFSLDWKDQRNINVSVTRGQKKTVPSIIFLSDAVISIKYSSSPDILSSRHYLLNIPVIKQNFVFEASLPSRGFYHPTNPQLIIRDFSHFFAFTINKNISEMPDPLVVFPSPETLGSIRLPHSKIGKTRGKSTFRRSEDLYETRTYTSGDDPRKINWKVFAHTGELSIRQGELLPPPSTEYVCIIDTFCSENQTDKYGFWFDVLLNRAAFLIGQLLLQKKTVTFLSIDNSGTIHQDCINPLDTNNTKTLLTLLSIPQITKADFPIQRLLKAVQQNASILYFTLPQNLRSLEYLYGYLNILSVFIGPNLEVGLIPSKKDRLKNTLFIPEKPSNYSAQELQKTLSLDFTEFKKRGFNVTKI